jgi:tripartite-type tricarboxylate transporter receptor subunit TctC
MMSPAICYTLRPPRLWPALAVALIVPLAAGGASAQVSRDLTSSPKEHLA